MENEGILDRIALDMVGQKSEVYEHAQGALGQCIIPVVGITIMLVLQSNFGTLSYYV